MTEFDAPLPSGISHAIQSASKKFNSMITKPGVGLSVTIGLPEGLEDAAIKAIANSLGAPEEDKRDLPREDGGTDIVWRIPVSQQAHEFQPAVFLLGSYTTEGIQASLERNMPASYRDQLAREQA